MAGKYWVYYLRVGRKICFIGCTFKHSRRFGLFYEVLSSEPSPMNSTLVDSNTLFIYFQRIQYTFQQYNIILPEKYRAL